MMDIEQFAGSFKPWDELAEQEKGFFCGDEYLPLPKNHKARLSVLTGLEARQMIKQAWFNIPEYKSGVVSDKRHEEHIPLADVWGDKDKIQEVRQWLYGRAVPYSSTVYLLYDSQVVMADWKFLGTYWDALAWNVGMAMVATDLTGNWACEFHHEDVITFYSYVANK